MEIEVVEGAAVVVEIPIEIAGCGRRTLQRRLAEEGVTCREIVDRARCRVAISELQDEDVKLHELSQRLGYSEQSAFSRAFRRWTGVSPGQYRTLMGDRSQGLCLTQ